MHETLLISKSLIRVIKKDFNIKFKGNNWKGLSFYNSKRSSNFFCQIFWQIFFGMFKYI